ncbi:MAG TPA: hypothetical protein VMF69_23935 [Gemmataceae bacterium]|nr:hypothetical protein [Gemmataceae bacterium]
MMRWSLLAVYPIAAVCSVWAAPAPPEGPRQIRLAPQSTAKQVGAFRYRLLPDPRDRTPGNAAPLWRLASDAFREAEHKMTNQEWDWVGIPLDKLPRKEVHDVLNRYTAAFRLARQAACREHCDWELPPLTFQSIQVYLPMAHLQRCREVANLLSIQFRLQLVEGRFDDAAETLQTSFALARHLCEGNMLIEILVGIAIDAIMFNRVEEWVQTSGSPNLYWALTALPRPLGNIRHTVEYEMNSLYRSYPGLHRIHRETLTAQEADSLANEVLAISVKMLGEKAKEVGALEKGKAAMLQATMYPQARKRLLAWGRSAKEIDAMPKAQVILLGYAGQWDRARDDMYKALIVPTWQGLPLMEAALKEHRSTDNVLLTLLLPTITKTWVASVRNERQLAGLRCAEALRLYAAAHEGKPPKKWSDITAVPLPIDPVAGKGFDGFYQVTDGRGILEIPPPPPLGIPSLGRRYELAPR